MLDAKAERALTEVIEQVRLTCGPRLVAVALYGSGAGPDYIPGTSDLNVVIVLDHVDDDVLAALRPHVARWRRSHVSTPLVLDRAFLRTAADVFPIELAEIIDRHRVLLGENVFASMQIQDEHLRYHCEHEGRAKLLRLRELFLEIGGNPRQLQAMLLDSVATFVIIVRALNRLRGVPRGTSIGESLQNCERAFDCPLTVLRRLLGIKRKEEEWGSESADEVYRSYIHELERLIGIIDQLPATRISFTGYEAE